MTDKQKKGFDALREMAIVFEEPMSKHTSFRIGGPAEVFAMPKNEDELKSLILMTNELEIPTFLLGNGSNLLVSDDGIDGVVVDLSGLCGIEIDGTTISAGAGVLLSKLASEALRANLSGLEFAHGIPGSVGGAVCMNAGAYGGQMSDVVVSTRVLDRNGVIREIPLSEHNYGYRKSIFLSDSGLIVLSTKLALKPEDHDKIESMMTELSLKRRSKQPLEYPSAGSVFKRPEGYFAGALIEDAGLKGRSVGGAEVSEKHAGFIINRGGATAKDVVALIEVIQKEVYEKYGVVLECEIRRVGRF